MQTLTILKFSSLLATWVYLEKTPLRTSWTFPSSPVQTDATLLDVTCCARLHILLHVVGCCCAKFETGQTFQPTTPNISFVPWSSKRSATMLDLFAQLFQHCWGHARSLHTVYKDLWVVSFPRCTAGPNIVGSCCIRLHTTANTHATTPNIVGATMLGVVASVCTPLPTRAQQLPTLLAQQCWELLHPFAHHCQHARNNSQHCWRNNVGSCCVRLHIPY